MQQYCGCYSLLLHYMPKNVLFVTYSRSISQPHTRLTEMTLGRQVDIAVLQFTASYEADRLSFRCWLSYYSFNSQPHTRLTRSCSDRRNVSGTFNSQPHTGLTNFFKVTFYFSCILSIHSLIRGWPYCPGRRSTMPMPFNSQPHTRLTFFLCEFRHRRTSFNSQPHTRLTHRGNTAEDKEHTFNSQPHTRLTMPHREQKPPVRSFNSQPHTRLTLRKC